MKRTKYDLIKIQRFIAKRDKNGILFVKTQDGKTRVTTLTEAMINKEIE